MSAKQRWYQSNKELTKRRAAESKVRKYEWYREYMSDKSCSICGVTENLQWHHLHDNKLDNVVVRRKENYVEKENKDAGWCGNVERTSKSVLDALIDLTILSKTNIMVNSPSSFLKTALLLRKING